MAWGACLVAISGSPCILRPRLLFFLQLLLCHHFKCDVLKHVLDVVSRFGTGCIELHTMLFSEFAAFTLLHLQVGQVILVCDEDAHDITISVLINLFQPVAHV